MTDDVAGYTLTRRDRMAVVFIDAAVKLGTTEFRERYRPVTDELFTHHFIDPTAKPAYQRPDLAPITGLDSDTDPLEIVRSHLGRVIDDRLVRDEARMDAERALTETEAKLRDVSATAADLDERLRDTTEQLRQREAEVAKLQTERETEHASLLDRHQTELGNLNAQHETDSEQATARHAQELDALHTEHQADIDALTRERDLGDSLIGERDSAIAAGDQWQNRFHRVYDEVSAGDLGPWPTEGEPGDRLVERVLDTLNALRTELETGRATLGDVEDIATSQLCEEDENDDYAIGSNDAAVLILDALNSLIPLEETDGTPKQVDAG